MIKIKSLIDIFHISGSGIIENTPIRLSKLCLCRSLYLNGVCPGHKIGAERILHGRNGIVLSAIPDKAIIGKQDIFVQICTVCHGWDSSFSAK